MAGSALHVAIVGAGIGGLATANALLQRGIDVRVYEQAKALTEVGAGIAIQRNGARALRTLGFNETLSRWGARWIDPQFRRADGAFIAYLWPPDRVEEFEYWGMHRNDLLRALADQLPANTLRTGHRCIGFDQDDTRATVIFDNGERGSADVVVAADGIHSALQRHVVESSTPIFSGSVAYRGLITTESVRWPAGPMRNWLGAGKRFMAYPVRNGDLLNYVGFVPTDEQMKESWSAPGDPAELAAEFAGWDPQVSAILSKVTSCFRWGLYDREPQRVWTRGRLALLGDAAHPMLPHVGQGANQAIEDAVALGIILEQAEPVSVPKALLVYERVRRERTARVQAMSRVSQTRFEATNDLDTRDRDMSDLPAERAWLWNYDAADAATAALSAQPLP